MRSEDMTKLKTRHGYTLVELMLASGLSFIVVLSAASIIISSFGFRTDIETKISIIRSQQDLQQRLNGLNFCTANMKDTTIHYDLANSDFLTNGLAINLKAIDTANKLTSEVVLAPGLKMGDLTIKKVLLKHVREIDRIRDLATVTVEFDHERADPIDVPIIVERNSNATYSDMIERCYGGNLLQALFDASGQQQCDMLKTLFLGGRGWIYDPVAGKCVPDVVDYILWPGPKYSVACPADHPYGTGYCDVINYDDSGCSTCDYQIGGTQTQASGYRCRAEAVGGKDGAVCEYALGVTGNCRVQCADKL